MNLHLRKQITQPVNPSTLHILILLLQDNNRPILPIPLRLHLNLKLCNRNPKNLQQRRLSRIQRFPSFAHLIPIPIHLQHNFPVDQSRRYTQFPQSRLNSVAERLVLAAWYLTRLRIYDAAGDSEGAGGDGARARKVCRVEWIEEIEDGLRGAGGEEEADGAG